MSDDGSGDTPPPPAAGMAAMGGGGGDLECSIYQNYSASEVFVQGLAGVVNQQARPTRANCFLTFCINVTENYQNYGNITTLILLDYYHHT